ncbi:TonB-linked outer membrane protein, SusC/RagA family [Pustulibacterium marinum]|uniref:TonB-linked outer membrane protein, SusC/RagA family n=1 Tax=Pustulibacterium marinum TaxID=1224947 RepID=A0A1I7HFB6_9FLAO|nr:TonB-dependent receptor [Pustulibacterium marinum]SFU59425.1 TonB-linked outer membrane protein, SusC/RagA family [Pustulibacterium marinum]
MKTIFKCMLNTKCLLLLAVFFAQNAFSQSTSQVSGTITSTDGQPVAFANVIVKGTSNGTSADFDGNYTIEAASDAVLVFSYIGFKTQEIPVNNQTTIDVTMQDDVATLDEVIVVGYGTQKKKDLTSSIAVVESDQIQKRQSTTVAESLQGLAAGVNVRGGGSPGQEAQIEIRGLKNLQNANPLYVIDGNITTANRDFNPNDIESIQILKDAAAAAIYGSRAANGVIIITTKKGKKGPLKIEVSSKMSITEVPRYDLAGQEEFVRLTHMAHDNAGIPRQNLDLSVNTDWQDEVFRTGLIQDQNLSFSGGGENTNFFMSANYFGNKGTVIDTDFDRLSFRVNSSGTKGIFKIGENLALSNSKTNETGGPEAFRGNPFIDVVRMFPTIPVRDEDNPGGYGYGEQGVANTFAANPVAIANLIDRSLENFRIRGNIFSELQPFEFLKYRLNFGYETSFDHFRHIRKTGNWTLNQPYEPSFMNENRAQFQRKLLENTLSFSKDFGKHNVNLVAGTTYQSDMYEQINGTKRNLLVNNANGQYFDVLDLGDNPQVGGFRTESILISYLGRLEYNYDNKYLLNAVVRRDGSSKFSDANKWSSFPSVSAAWRLSNESFFNVEEISDLKLRVSYGELGSGNIGEYEYLGFINTFGAVVMGNEQSLNPSATQVKLSNSELKWEILKQTNFGVDVSLFDNKLTATADYFIARTENVLFGFPILLSTGNDGGNPIANAATVENRGFEFNVNYNQQVNDDFSFNASLNLTTLRNELVSLGNGLNESIQGNTLTEAGQPVGMWYVLQTDGLFQSQDDVESYTNSEGVVIQPTSQPGDVKYKDLNDDGQITNEDKTVVGSPWPDFQMGFNGGFTYKNVDFSMNWIGSFGATVYNGYRSIVENVDGEHNYPAGIQPWTPENPNTDIPRAVNGNTLNSRGDSDRWLEDGSFVRLKYVGLGYNFKSDLIEKIGFNRARVSLSAQNILTITKYTGLDPEFSNGNIFQRGVDFGSFPNLHTYSLGVEFSF